MAQRGIHMTFKPEFRRSTLLAAAVALPVALALTMLAASPARADRCDDLAGQLKSQIDGLAVGKTAANLIYLSHPLARQITLGCSGRIGRDRARLTVRIHKALVSASSQSGQSRRIVPMSVSAVTASPPVTMPETSEPKAPDVKPDADASAPKPVVLAPLPPGQGTRIDQLV